MRESIGGTMLFWIVLFFMSIFIAFMAAIIQYARVYKIKNSLVNYLEQGEGIYDETTFNDALTKLGYPKGKSRKYVICKYKGENRGGYYYVKLYTTFSILNVSFDVGVKGETRLIETGVLINPTDSTSGWLVSGSCAGMGVSQAEMKREG